MKQTIIVLGGNIIAYGIIRGLKDRDVNVVVLKYNSNDFAHHSKYVHKSHNVCDPNIDENIYLKALLAYGERYKGALLIPVNDDTLIVISKYKKVLSDFFHVAALDLKTLEFFFNKEQTYKLCEKLQIAHPKTFYPASLKDLEKDRERIPFPCIVKPCFSHEFVNDFNVKLFLVHNFEDLKIKFHLAQIRRHKVIIQEYIEHVDNIFGVIAYYDNKGRFRQSFQTNKLRFNPPGQGVCRVAIQVTPGTDEIELQTRKLLDNMNYQGPASVNYIYDKKNKKYKLLEVNARFTRIDIFPIYCGINYPEMMLDDYINGMPKEYKIMKKDSYWIDLYADIKSSLLNFSKENLTMKDYIIPYFNKNKVFAVLNKEDLLPFVMMILLLPLKYYRILKALRQKPDVKPNRIVNII